MSVWIIWRWHETLDSVWSTEKAARDRFDRLVAVDGPEYVFLEEQPLDVAEDVEEPTTTAPAPPVPPQHWDHVHGAT